MSLLVLGTNTLSHTQVGSLIMVFGAHSRDFTSRINMEAMSDLCLTSHDTPFEWRLCNKSSARQRVQRASFIQRTKHSYGRVDRR